jgi:hypothetical protein
MKPSERAIQNKAEGEILRDIWAEDRSAALCFREARACYKSAEAHLATCRELITALEKLKDRRGPKRTDGPWERK